MSCLAAPPLPAKPSNCSNWQSSLGTALTITSRGEGDWPMAPIRYRASPCASLRRPCEKTNALIRVLFLAPKYLLRGCDGARHAAPPSAELPFGLPSGAECDFCFRDGMPHD